MELLYFLKSILNQCKTRRIPAPKMTSATVKDHRSTISSGKILNRMNAAPKSYYTDHITWSIILY